jgi:Na+-driven multidrug efflux pump
MLALSFARQDKQKASATLSDALVIALGLGVALAVAMYFYSVPMLQRIAGQASAAVVEPAVIYVRIRCGSQRSYALI